MEVAENTQQHERTTSAHIVDCDVLHAGKDIVADRLDLLPLKNLWAEAIVGKALCRVDQGVASELETDIDCFNGCPVGTRDLIWVVLYGPALSSVRETGLARDERSYRRLNLL